MRVKYIMVSIHLLGAVLLLFHVGHLQGRDGETFILRQALSKNVTVAYKRVIRFDKGKNLYRVKDYFENGLIQMDALCSSFDKNIKEDYQCNYRSNTKEGGFRAWYKNGQITIQGSFRNGLRNGPSTFWYENGQKEAEENWLHGQLHGRVKYWTEMGELQFSSTFDHGLNTNPKDSHYQYLSYLPKGYETDTDKKWPLIIYLHGGSRRGRDLKKLYADGIPDQIYRGRDFPFVIVAPQCPENIRWSTDDWFEAFYSEVIGKYRIDQDRVYLTGLSLGGEGTWYLAAKYPEKFAAIAPMCGFTGTMDYIETHVDRLRDMPIWAFHGEKDTVVAFEETARMIRMLEGKNKEMKFSREPESGHGLPWMVYPGQELYDWLLQHSLTSRRSLGQVPALDKATAGGGDPGLLGDGL